MPLRAVAVGAGEAGVDRDFLHLSGEMLTEEVAEVAIWLRAGRLRLGYRKRLRCRNQPHSAVSDGITCFFRDTMPGRKQV